MTKKNKNRNMIFIVVAVIALIGLGLYMYKPIQQPVSMNPNEGFLTMRMFDRYGNTYDQNGNLIQGTYSIVEGSPGITSIAFTVSVKNTGAEVLSCSLLDLRDYSGLSGLFNSSFVTKDTKTPSPGLTVAWTGNPISTSTYENPSDRLFNATVRCSYTVGSETTIFDRSGWLFVAIRADAGTSGNALVNVTRGGVPSTWCGDNICQSSEGETCVTCPSDPCGAGGTSCTQTGGVKFRTSDLAYVSGSAIAFNKTVVCPAIPSILQTASYLSSGSGGGTCAAWASGAGFVAVTGFTTLPGGIPCTGGTITSTKLYTSGSIYAVCSEYSGCSGSKYKKYDTGTPSSISGLSTTTSWDPGKESAC